MNFLSYFTDSVLQAPTIGSMLLCAIAAVVGSCMVLRGKSLVGEMLSHTAYPGVVIALLAQELFFIFNDEITILFVVLCGALISCLVGIYFVQFLERKFRVLPDSALAMTLSSFFGIGLLLLSATQQEFPTLYKTLQAYLFGQAATMQSIHLQLYGIFSAILVCILIFFFRDIQLVIFDTTFARLATVPIAKIEALIFFMTVCAVVMGIRSCGVVLITSMLVFPTVIARQFTNSFKTLLCLAALLGLICGFFGVVTSHEISLAYQTPGGKALSVPTGPMIVSVAFGLFALAFLFSRQNGLITRLSRRWRYLLTRSKENLLKLIWKECSLHGTTSIHYHTLEHISGMSTMRLKMTLWWLQHTSYLKHSVDDTYELTPLGMLWGRKIVRLHRLWELYLVECCKVAKERVHPSAEEMEHIITPELEAELNFRLKDPLFDPHHKPIPSPENKVLLS